MKTHPLSERSITDRLAALTPIPKSSELVLGIGDDCAIYRQRGSKEDLLFTSDLFIEDIHFRRETHTANDVAHNALTRSLSDIAAMGGSPRFALAAVCVPSWANDRWVKRFFDCLLAGLAASGAVLAGGDLSRGQTFACDLTVCGAVPRGSALRRDGASPGDAIYVSGLLGGSALGLESGRGRAWKRHVNPQARLQLGQYLRRRKATSAIDISDGLSLDLCRLCLASNVSAEIEAPPLFPGATLDHALHGGEEYELLFTLPYAQSVPKQLDELPLTRIGTICNGVAGEVWQDGRLLAPQGYDHFGKK